jgi:hypothetical protein
MGVSVFDNFTRRRDFKWVRFCTGVITVEREKKIPPLGFINPSVQPMAITFTASAIQTENED